MIANLTEHEFDKLRGLLKNACGITLSDDQDYLVETRLTDLGNELGAETFGDMHRMIIQDQKTLLPRIIDLMTTNETLWFRDDSLWKLMRSYLMPLFIEKLEKNAGRIRIWSAASSTGQELYSLVILISEILEARGKLYLLDKIELLGTDISTTALSIAKRAVYDSFTIKRGLSEINRDKYFEQIDKGWALRDDIKNKVVFKELNLMNSFSSLGKFDMVFCRNVAIYFSSDFKKELFSKIEGLLNPGGALLIGASESLMGISTNFKLKSSEGGVFYHCKNDPAW